MPVSRFSSFIIVAFGLDLPIVYIIKSLYLLLKKTTLADLAKDQKGIITNYPVDIIPIKLAQMGCLSGIEVKCLQVAPLGCPIYLNIENTFVAIRKETARLIEIHIRE